MNLFIDQTKQKMFRQFLALILVMETISCLDFGRLVVNDQKSKDDIELKNEHGHVLVTSFNNAHIASAQKNGSSTSGKVVFARDPTAQHNYALVHEVENDIKISHYSMVWMNPLPNEEFCVHIGDDQHWYSTYEEYVQKWPIDKTKNYNNPEPMSTSDMFGKPIGGIVENLFVGSQGFGIYIERSSPLFLRREANNGKPLLCFSGDYGKYPYIHAMDTKEIKIVFHLLSGTDIMHVLRYAQNSWIQKPKGIPDQRMIKYPIWYATNN